MVKTKEKKITIKKMLLMICVVAVFITTVLGGSTTEVQAASKAKKAKQAYAKYLANEKADTGENTYANFAIVDVNKDGIPELLGYSDAYNSIDLLTYSNGKVKHIEGFFGAGTVRVYPSSKIIYVNGKMDAGMYYDTYYRFDGKKCKNVVEAYDTFEGDVEYRMGDKIITKQEFKKKVNSLKLKKPAKLKVHENTAKNRKKYLGSLDKEQAATKVGKTSKISCDCNGPYYKYIEDKNHIIGDCNSYEIRWASVSGADGYQVRLNTLTDGVERKTYIINVKKSGGTYTMKMKEASSLEILGVGKKTTVHTDMGDYKTRVSNTVKDGIITVKTKDLRFVITCGTAIELEKISIRAYKNVNGKKIYGKYMTKKIPVYN